MDWVSEYHAMQDREETSAQAREASLDALVTQVAALTQASHRSVAQLTEHRVTLDAHAHVLWRLTFWERMHWLVTGR